MNKTLLGLLAGIAVAAYVQAAELNQFVPEKSEITFVSKQMGVPEKGRFKKFDARIVLDPAKPEAGKANIDVELSSIEAGSSDADTEVKSKGWLNVAAFPKATFVSTSVRPLGNGRYEAKGSLTIKGISRDTTIPFVLRNEGAGAWLEGGFMLKRLLFKIGEGDWSDTSTVADEVDVKFKLFVVPKK